MKSDKLLDAIGSVDDSFLNEAPKKERGSIRFRGRWIVAAVCIGVLLIGGTVYAASEIGKIAVENNGKQTIKMQLPPEEGSEVIETEMIVYTKTYELTSRADPNAFSDELKAALEDPEGQIPPAQLAGGYEPGGFLDQVFFPNTQEAMAFVGYDGMVDLDALGLKLIRGDTPCDVGAFMEDGEIAGATVQSNYEGTGNVWGVICDTSVYTEACKDYEFERKFFSEEPLEIKTITAASGGEGVQIMSKEFTEPETDIPYHMIEAEVPVGPIVYTIHIWVNSGCEAEAEAIIANWLSLI